MLFTLGLETVKSNKVNSNISNAVDALRKGGVIAYPTEHCFGLGCDPRNHSAIERLLNIKQRKKDQGVILIAETLKQVSDYADLDNVPLIDQVKNSWPGPNTWLLPVNDKVSSWVRGKHKTIAMSISSHLVCQQLCNEFAHALVSTSANRHGEDALLNANDVYAEFNDELDYIVDLPVGGASKPSVIRNSLTGEQLR